MLWFYATIISYFFYSISALYDRYILVGPLNHPRSFAFYVGITGFLATILIPFGFSVPSLYIILISLFAGAVGVAGLVALYTAIYSGHVSTAVPSVGALVPIFTLLTGLVVAGQRIIISLPFIASLFLLIAGSFLLSSQTKKGFTFSKKLMLLVIGAAAFLGMSFGITKAVYDATGFVNGFIWMRWGGGVSSVALLLSKKTRDVIFKENPIVKKKVYSPIIWSKVVGGAGFLFQQFAINTATFTQVPVVNALVGIQYFFILFFVWLLSLKKPKLLKEELSKHGLAPRIIGISLIAVGTWLLFV